jgi:hypothetical protein
MEKIEYIAISRLRNPEHFQFVSDVDTLIQKTAEDTLAITDLYMPFKEAFSEETARMKIELGSRYSSQIIEADKLRDKTWNSIHYRLKGTVLCPIEAEVNAGLIILRVVDGFGDVRNRSYKEETGLLNRLISVLLADDNLPHLNTIGITSWVHALSQQNKDFENLINDRNEELANRLKGDVRESRMLVDPLYLEIVDHINALITLKMAKPGVEPFVKQLNQFIRYYITTIDIREGRKEAKKKGASASGTVK